MIDRGLHPRPQAARESWASLDGEWGFAEDPDDVGVAARWFDDPERFAERILVPFPPESAASGIARDVCSTIWYRHRIETPMPAGRRRILHFEGVDYAASVWVDGVHLIDHEGGQTGFAVDVTDVWGAHGAVVTVRAVDRAWDLEQPRGKQDWLSEPHVIWYHRTSGIWRSVWFEDVPVSSIDTIHWVPGAAFGTVDAEVRVRGPRHPGQAVRLTFRHEGVVVASSTHQLINHAVRTCTTFSADAFEPEPEQLWWSPETPTLIDAEVELLDGGEVVDSVSSYVGLRTVGVDDRSLLLNGRPYFLRLVLEQGYWPESHLAAPSAESLRDEVELIKSLGFNGIRVHQKVADPRFLYWCDRLGLLVWADAAASYRFSPTSLARTTREWINIVERDRNHPSVVAWVPFNESWGVPSLETDPAQRWAVTALYALLKALDGSRPVLGNDGWEYVAGDVVGIHDYSHDEGRLDGRYRTLDAVRHTVSHGRAGGRRISLGALTGTNSPADRPVVLSEFGGFTLSNDPEQWSGYGSVRNSEHLLQRLREVLAVVGPDSGLAGYCYTQLTDTLQEQNGLLTGDRRPKADPGRIAAIVRGDR
jgi:beta-galactosidase/beta-glucuronidase